MSSVAPISPINVLNSIFQTMQSIASGLYGTFISDGYEILQDLSLFMIAWLLLNWILVGGLPEIMSKGLALLIKAAFIMFLLSGWTTSTHVFFVNNMEQVASQVSGGTPPNAQVVMQTVWSGAIGMFQTTRNTAANPCLTVTGAAVPNASGGAAAPSGCNSTAAPTEPGIWSAIGTWVKNFPLILLTLVFKIIAAIALLLMGGVYVLVVQMGSILLSVAFILGPILVPWYLLPATEFLFTGWLKFTIVAGLYKVVAWLLVTIVIGGVLPALTALLNGITSAVSTNTDDYYGSAYLTYMAVAFVACVGAYMMKLAPTIASGLISGQGRLNTDGFGKGLVGRGISNLIPGLGGK